MMISVSIALVGIMFIVALFILGIGAGDRVRATLNLQAVSWIVLTGVLFTWWTQDGVHDQNFDLAMNALTADGRVVSTTVVFEPKGKERLVRSIQLEQTASGALGLAIFAWLLATIALLMGLMRSVPKSYTSLGNALNGTLCLVSALLIYLTQENGGGGGHDMIRSYLNTLNLQESAVDSFTVPEGSWSFQVPMHTSLYFIFGTSLFAVCIPRIKPVNTHRMPLLLFAVLVAIAALAYQGFVTNGFPWRPIEAALFTGVALAVGARALEKQHTHLTIAVLSSAIGVLALVV